MRIPGTAMGASFVLIPGAGGMAWYWHRVAALLETAHNEAIAVDLPANDANAGLKEYTDIVLRATGRRSGVILVAQSLGGFTAPLVCARPEQLLVTLDPGIGRRSFRQLGEISVCL
jgi:pimeloyl-ACP methyl ester carboxylesterase